MGFKSGALRLKLTRNSATALHRAHGRTAYIFSMKVNLIIA